MLIQRPGSCSRTEEKQQGHQHGEIRAGVAHHKPESLVGMREFGYFGGGDRGADDDQERDRGESGTQPNEHERPAENLERSDKVSSEVWVWEADSGEAEDAHIGVGVLEDSLAQEYEAHRETNE